MLTGETSHRPAFARSPWLSEIPSRSSIILWLSEVPSRSLIIRFAEAPFALTCLDTKVLIGAFSFLAGKRNGELCDVVVAGGDEARLLRKCRVWQHLIVRRIENCKQCEMIGVRIGLIEDGSIEVQSKDNRCVVLTAGDRSA